MGGSDIPKYSKHVMAKIKLMKIAIYFESTFKEKGQNKFEELCDQIDHLIKDQ